MLDTIFVSASLILATVAIILLGIALMLWHKGHRDDAPRLAIAGGCFVAAAALAGIVYSL